MAFPDPHYPIIAMFGPFTVTTWGFFVALGFLAGLFFIAKEAKRRGLDIDEVYTFALISIVAGLLGARIGWIITEGWGINFREALRFWGGGLIWHGGIIGALLGTYAYAVFKKINFLKYADVFAIGIPLGHAIGRIGCFFGDYHLGRVTEVPWAILVNGEPRHPVTLYELIFLVPLFLILWKIRKKEKFDGWMLGIYILSYAAIRFLLDFFRTDPTYLGLTVAQYVSVFAVAAAGLFLFINRKGKVF